MDTNGVITISSKDWSRQPIVETENIPEIILYWKHSTVSSAVGMRLKIVFLVFIKTTFAVVS